MISEVTADWHELMIPQSTMRPFIAHVSEQLDLRCSKQAYHCSNQTHKLNYYSFFIPQRIGNWGDLSMSTNGYV